MINFVEYRDEWISVSLPANLVYKGGFWTFRSDRRRFKNAYVDLVGIDVTVGEQGELARDALLKEFRAAGDRDIGGFVKRKLRKGPVDGLAHSFGVINVGTNNVSESLNYSHWTIFKCGDFCLYTIMSKYHASPPYVEFGDFQSTCDRICLSVAVTGNPRGARPRGSE